MFVTYKRRYETRKITIYHEEIALWMKAVNDREGLEKSRLFLIWSSFFSGIISLTGVVIINFLGVKIRNRISSFIKTWIVEKFFVLLVKLAFAPPLEPTIGEGGKCCYVGKSWSQCIFGPGLWLLEKTIWCHLTATAQHGGAAIYWL